MITLSISAKDQALIERASLQSGMTVEQFFLASAHEKAMQISQSKQKILLTDLLKDLPSAEFSDDGLRIQQELRDEWD